MALTCSPCHRVNKERWQDKSTSSIPLGLQTVLQNKLSKFKFGVWNRCFAVKFGSIDCNYTTSDMKTDNHENHMSWFGNNWIYMVEEMWGSRVTEWVRILEKTVPSFSLAHSFCFPCCFRYSIGGYTPVMHPYHAPSCKFLPSLQSPLCSLQLIVFVLHLFENDYQRHTAT